MKEYKVKVYKDRTEWYNAKGQLHREDGPAVEWSDGDKAWYFNGKLHREDGPAVVTADGDKQWYQNGKRHREDGPAVEYADGYKRWYLNGERLTEEQFNKTKRPCVGKKISIDEVEYELK